MLRALDQDIWVAERPLRLAGCAFGTRASIVRLADGGLFVHCPVSLEQGLQAEIAALGPVQHLVAANKMHHFWLAENAEAFPDARVHLAPGLAEKRAALPPGEALGAGPGPWSADLDELLVGGVPTLAETVFLHRKTRTLILTDLAFNLRAPRPPFERVVLRILGAWDCFGPSRIARSFIRDKKQVRRDLDRILAWDFERVVLTHGEIVEKGGRDALRASYSFL